MTNKSSSKKHGMVRANELRPKSKLRKRANKAKANVRKAQARSEWQSIFKKSFKITPVSVPKVEKVKDEKKTSPRPKKAKEVAKKKPLKEKKTVKKTPKKK
ncbi:MAG TPA: hypothetical protein ENI70_01955 [Candidatus Peregrinibacteria bacterium]|nr:hypothetical protein [Candidatus Peregrinibacteria bacterium]